MMWQNIDASVENQQAWERDNPAWATPTAYGYTS
jgi:hypothetical protein